MHSSPWRVAWPLLLVLAWGTAEAAPRAIKKVSYKGTKEAMRVELTGSAPIPADAVKLGLAAKDKVIVIKVDGFKMKRGWLKWKDKQIHRVLGKQVGKQGRIRIRIAGGKKYSEELLEAARISVDGKKLVVELPRNAAVAEAWGAPPPPKVVVQ